MRVAYPPYQPRLLRVDVGWISATHPPQSSKMLLTNTENAVINGVVIICITDLMLQISGAIIGRFAFCLFGTPSFTTLIMHIHNAQHKYGVYAMPQLYDQNAPKKAANLSINSDLLSKSQEA
jgi:hypothetical protein